MIFDIPYHHRKCEELALKKIFVNYTFSGRYLVVGRGEKKQDITLVRYEYNKKCISYFYNIDHTGSKIINIKNILKNIIYSYFKYTFHIFKNIDTYMCDSLTNSYSLSCIPSPLLTSSMTNSSSKDNSSHKLELPLLLKFGSLL